MFKNDRFSITSIRKLLIGGFRKSEIVASLRKHPLLLALRRWGRFARRNARNVPIGEEQGETDVFAG